MKQIEYLQILNNKQVEYKPQKFFLYPYVIYPIRSFIK